MSNEDSVNLKFLLSASAEVLLDWYKSADDDDLVYANELLASHQERLDRTQIRLGYCLGSKLLH